MTREEFATLEMLGKIAGFHKTYENRIPPGSLMRAAFDSIDAARATISALGALPGRNGTRPGTAARDAAREILRADLEAIHQTVLAIAIDHPGIETNFRLPKGRRQDQQLIRAAQEFIKYATPLKNAFVAHYLPEDFLDKLTSEIEALEQGINQQAQGKSDRLAASETLTHAIDDALVALQRLDAIIPNTFGTDTHVMTAWTTAREIKKPRSKKKADTAESNIAPSPSTPAAASEAPATAHPIIVDQSPPPPPG